MTGVESQTSQIIDLLRLYEVVVYNSGDASLMRKDATVDHGQQAVTRISTEKVDARGKKIVSNDQSQPTS